VIDANSSAYWSLQIYRVKKCCPTFFNLRGCHFLETTKTANDAKNKIKYIKEMSGNRAEFISQRRLGTPKTIIVVQEVNNQ